MAFRLSLAGPARTLLAAFNAAVGRLDKSLSPFDTIARLRAHTFVPSDAIYVFHLTTCQFLLPCHPIFAWLLAFYTNRFIPADYRPSVHVVLLPTLETVLYGANISDILTRFTHPILDLLAWLPYGVIHYALPIVLAIFLWLFRPPLVLKTWAKTFGYMNLTGVCVQILLPCAAPWYELIYGLTPATYGIAGSPGGLVRIDALFSGDGYQRAFGSSPLVFGAFPSLHAAWATLAALFVSHSWQGAGASHGHITMYLTHHYLIDVVGGACLATTFFHLFMPDELRTAGGWGVTEYGVSRSKYERYDLENRRPRGFMGLDDFASDTAESADLSDEIEEENIVYRSPNPSTGGGSISPKKPSMQNGSGSGRTHRHTASIASLIRSDERSEGWGPIGNKGFSFPPVTR
ncbi:PAP2-domain-containing protein [Pisolithus marmoratus]|nr:PAP2-domain-containing protein [Pisolithus marmoratus]